MWVGGAAGVEARELHKEHPRNTARAELLSGTSDEFYASGKLTAVDRQMLCI